MEDREYSAYLAEIRAGTDLVSLASDHLTLRRAGRRLKALCPFHEEKTPSFSIDPDKGLFYCFGCNTGGDAFKFLMLKEGLEFVEAARQLGERIGIHPPERKGPGAERRRRVLEANARAHSFFRAQIADAAAGRAARDYLSRRGVGDEVIEAFELGFAPDSWDRLRDSLAAAGMEPRAGVEAGVIIDKNSDGKRLYDRFRNRVIFPIRSLGGEVVAFGGRTLDGDEKAKYLNSPESPVYIKGEVLYGLDRARAAIRDKGHAILVEGYLDLVGLVARGFENVVATLGTALTASQAKLLRRYTDRAVICYDPDAAGARATLRALEIFLGMEFRATVLRLPDGLDPDDFVRERGAEAFHAALKGSTPAVEYLAETFAAELDLDDPRQRAAGVNKMLPFLARLDSAIERTGYLPIIAARFRVEEDLVVADVRQALKKGARGVSLSAPPKSGPARRSPTPPPPVQPAELRLLGALLASRKALDAVLEEIELDDFHGSRIEPVLRTLVEYAREEPEGIEPAVLAEKLPDEESRTLMTRALLAQEVDEGSVEDARNCLRAVEKSRLTRERERIQRELHHVATRSGGDPATVNDLMVQKMDLSRKIDAL